MRKIAPFKYLPFSEGQPYQMKMGLQPLPSERWIEIDETFAPQLSAKRVLFDTRPGHFFQALPEAERASEETLRLLLGHLRQHHADAFEFEAAHIRNLLTGERWDIAHSRLHPLDQAGRLVQEDFCILQS